MASETTEPRVFPVDIDHIGVRLVVPVVTVLACIGTYWLGLQITLNSAGAWLVVAPVAIGVALGTAWLLERLLRRYWPSGRALHIDADGLALRKAGVEEVRIAWERRINVLTWYFVVPPRRGRIPKNWLCMSVQLLQDEDYMTLYTFMPPEQAEALPVYDSFIRLVPRKQLEKEGAWLQSGIQAQLHAAEQVRWHEGAEHPREDFIELLDVLAIRVTGWPGDEPPRLLQDRESEHYERPPSKGDSKPIQL